MRKEDFQVPDDGWTSVIFDAKCLQGGSDAALGLEDRGETKAV